MSNVTYFAAMVPILQSALKSLNFYGSVLILFPGVLLNSFTIVFLMRKRFWSNGLKMGFFYSLDATFNLLVVGIGIVAFFPSSLGQDLMVKGSTWCQMIWFARYQLTQLSGYFSVLVTLERTVSILNHRPIRPFSKYKYLGLMTVLILVIVSLTNVMSWWRYVINVPTTSGNRTIFVPICSGPSWVIIGSAMVGIISRFSTPVVNMIMNMLIIRALIKSKSRMRTSRDENGISKKQYYFAFSLLANNFIFFFLSFPTCVLQAMMMRNLFVPPTQDKINITNVLFSIVAWGNYIYAALPFINNLAFNKIFRSELFGLFTDRVHRVSVISSSLLAARSERSRQ